MGASFERIHALSDPFIALTGPDSAKGRWIVHAYLTRQGDNPVLKTIGGHEDPLLLTPFARIAGARFTAWGNLRSRA